VRPCSATEWVHSLLVRNRILVVEDDLELVELLHFNLTKAGFQVGIATDGARALQLARAKCPSLILLDVMLPELDGLAVCEILRRDQSTRKIPIIILTAMSSQLARAAGLEAGANDYIAKPFSMKDLLTRIGAALQLPATYRASES
jgi:DNA-binding response OmpR family regulator